MLSSSGCVAAVSSIYIDCLLIRGLDQDIRESKSASPIVFIAHSLGGNIVKKVT